MVIGKTIMLFFTIKVKLEKQINGNHKICVHMEMRKFIFGCVFIA